MATIENFSYNVETKELSVIFGYDVDSTYVYVDVPKIRYTELLTADSKGSYIGKNIKGKYDFEKIES